MKYLFSVIRTVQVALCAATFILCFAAAAPAQHAPAPYRLGEAVSAAQTMLTETMNARPVPGLAIAVMVDGQLIWSEGFGHADLEQRVPMWPTSKGRIGSVSKPMAAAAAMRLVDQGLLDLDAPVQQYVPYFPEKRWTVTTRQLGGHLAGVRHYRGAEMLSAIPYATVKEGIDIFATDSLLHEPGSTFFYTSYGWNLISAVVEGAASKPFLEVMRTEVFGPLGLRQTVADHPDSLISQRVRFYDRSADEGFVNATYVDNSYKWAGGGFLSSVKDMARFGSAHLESGYLSDSARAVLFTSQTTAAGEPTGYGFGWRTSEHEGFDFLAHAGGSVGGSTHLIMQPGTRVVVATHTNLSGHSLEDVTTRIAVLFASSVTDDHP